MFKDGAYYNGIGPALKDHFGMRIVKASIDGGFTCPNRDGTIGWGGCIFCSQQGSGDFTGNFKQKTHSDCSQMENHFNTVPNIRQTAPITEQINAQLELMHRKWKNASCIAYFQSYTNTYAPVSILKDKYEEALAHPLCKGLAIATRPDCLNDDILDYLTELNARTFMWVELGLQTIHDETAAYINRGCSLADYDDAVNKLISRGIRVVTHLIFGLPGESRQDMLASVEHICRKKIYGIKIQLLHIMKETVLGNLYIEQLRDGEAIEGKEIENEKEIEIEIEKNTVDTLTYKRNFKKKIIPMTKDQYISYVADALEIIPADITIHRLTGDAPVDLLIEPQWSRDKKSVLNGINMELKRRGTWQGINMELKR